MPVIVVMCGSVTVCVTEAHSAASHAFPPARSSLTAARVACGLDVITSPFLPLATGFFPKYGVTTSSLASPSASTGARPAPSAIPGTPGTPTAPAAAAAVARSSWSSPRVVVSAFRQLASAAFRAAIQRSMCRCSRKSGRLPLPITSSICTSDSTVCSFMYAIPRSRDQPK
jgi:hypothetical protein